MRHDLPLIRQAVPAHAAALAELRWQFRAESRSPDEDLEVFVERCTAWFAERLASGRWRAWVALADGEIVGHVFAAPNEKIPNPVPEPEHHLYVSNLYVQPRWRRRGVGAALLAAALAVAGDDADLDAAILWAPAERRALYARHGFDTPAELLERRPVGNPERPGVR